MVISLHYIASILLLAFVSGISVKKSEAKCCLGLSVNFLSVLITCLSEKYIIQASPTYIITQSIPLVSTDY